MWAMSDANHGGGVTPPDMPKPQDKPASDRQAEADASQTEQAAPKPPKEIGGPTGPEPTRYGDWERKGRVSDF